MERIGVWLVALATAGCCLLGGAPSARAKGGQTIAEAPGVKLNATIRDSLQGTNFIAGYSVSFWTVSFAEGDRISIRTTARNGETPPCQILYMPGADDNNINGATPILDPASTTRNGSVDGQRWVATQTGSYVLAMTNDDVFLSGAHQCLDAPSGKPFTFKVTVSPGGARKHSEQSDGSGNGGGGTGSSGGSGNGSTRIVRPGQSLWVIAQGIVGRPASIGEIAFEVGRLWRLNGARIGTGNPDLIYAGQELRLR
jgi:uncharacterized membrane protein YgcG